MASHVVTTFEDFVKIIVKNAFRGCRKWHFALAGIVAIVCGLPLTALLFLFFRGRSGEDSVAPGQ